MYNNLYRKKNGLLWDPNLYSVIAFQDLQFTSILQLTKLQHWENVKSWKAVVDSGRDPRELSAISSVGLIVIMVVGLSYYKHLHTCYTKSHLECSSSNNLLTSRSS